MENKLNPKLSPHISQFFLDIDEESKLILIITEYVNAIQAVVYQDIPKIGSSVLAFDLNGIKETRSIFAGNHELLASSMGQILAKYGKIVYAFLYLEHEGNVTLDHLRNLLDQFHTERSNTSK